MDKQLVTVLELLIATHQSAAHFEELFQGFLHQSTVTASSVFTT